MSRKPWWWGASKDWVARQEISARRESDDDLPVDAEPVTVTHRQLPGRKDTRRWCGGKPEREHVLVVEIPANNAGWKPTCGWRVQTWRTREPDVFFTCRHVELCSTCGKVFRTPHWPVSGKLRRLPPQEALAQAASAGWLAPAECPVFTSPPEAGACT